METSILIGFLSSILIHRIESGNHDDIFKRLLGKCNISPEANWPNQFESNKRLNISLQMVLDRFVDVDDVLETFVFIGQIGIFWESQCISKLYQNESIWPSDFYRFDSVPYWKLWQPNILHRNSFTETMELGGNNPKKVMGINMKKGTVNVWTFGKFTSYCSLDFTNFPFDK